MNDEEQLDRRVRRVIYIIMWLSCSRFLDESEGDVSVSKKTDMDFDKYAKGHY